MTDSPLLDIAAFIWVLVCWIGYTGFADHSRWRSESAMAAMDAYRTRWMKRMLERAPRIEDIQIIGNLMRSVSFFASTAIFVLAGFVAVLGAADRAHAVISGLPFTVRTSPEMWQLKVLFLIVIFVYAFFKFTWSLRQFNYLSIIVGGAPAPGDDNPDDADYAERAARVQRHRRHPFQPRPQGLLFRSCHLELVRPPLAVHFAFGLGGACALSPRIPLAHPPCPGLA